MTSKDEKSFKETKKNCPFTLSAKILKEPPSNHYPCYIEIRWNHNYPINSLQSWSFKDISQDSVESIEKLFMNGMTLGNAYQEFTSKLRLQCDGDLMKYHKSWDMLTKERLQYALHGI